MTAQPAPPATVSRPAGNLPQTLLGYVLETRLARPGGETPEVTLNSPWDLWWVAFRTAVPAGQLGVAGRSPMTSCTACADDATELSAADPHGIPA